MRRLIACSALVSALVPGLLGSSAALAAEDSAPLRNQTYLVPGISYFGNDDENDIDPFVAGQIGIGGQFTDNFALEFIYGAGQSDFDGGAANSGDVDIDYLRLDGIYDLGGETWKPYFAGGVGRVTLEPDAGGRERDTQLNFGAGVMRSITDRLSVRGDTRFYYSVDARENQPGASLSLRYVFAGPTAPPDGDGDGVSDATDQCPGTPRGAQVDRFGCEVDSDADGVADSTDACPRTSAGVSVDSRGCPVDSDGDGVADHLDQCPRTPRGDEVDAEGCTIVEEVEVERMELRLQFDYDSSDLRPGHFAEIERVATFMRENPDTNAQLEGHTDNRGTEAYNQALSERRAYSVRDYLIDEADIDPRRITAVGYGEARPTTTNDTDAGRQRNRRVEAVIQTGEMSIRQRRDN